VLNKALKTCIFLKNCHWVQQNGTGSIAFKSFSSLTTLCALPARADKDWQLKNRVTWSSQNHKFHKIIKTKLREIRCFGSGQKMIERKIIHHLHNHEAIQVAGPTRYGVTYLLLNRCGLPSEMLHIHCRLAFPHLPIHRYHLKITATSSVRQLSSVKGNQHCTSAAITPQWCSERNLVMTLYSPLFQMEGGKSQRRLRRRSIS